MTTRAIYPGTFDPITNGHIDLIGRASSIFDTLLVAVTVNTSKQPLFSLEQRLELASQAAAKFPNVSVIDLQGLLVDCAVQHNTKVIIRGLRAVTDFDYEFQMATMNQKLCKDVDTLFLAASTEHTFISSSMIREIAQLGGSVSEFVPDYVESALQAITNQSLCANPIEV
ncbi:MAG: pantetheine-phosphate adenylyltransferase [Gammaproteobacteria bacterium]|nr:pantetheine-phosphate adenylyltransferase [Gammaproteobacteria bacterium]